MAEVKIVGRRDLRITTLAQEPELASQMWTIGASIWPRFMTQDPIGDRYYNRVEQDFAHTCVLALNDQEVVARAFFIPFEWDGGALPDRGWDAVIERGVDGHDAGVAATAASALEIGIVPAWRGRGVSTTMLRAMKAAVGGLGHSDLFAPVRPSGKHCWPHESMADYVARTTPEGLPADPWLRVHVREGGAIVKIAPRSMTITGTLAQWNEWTGTHLDVDGPTVLPDALAPVHVKVADDTATYVEPNVWVHHQMR